MYRSDVEDSINNISNLEDDAEDVIDVSALSDEDALARLFGENTEAKASFNTKDISEIYLHNIRSDYMRTHGCGCVRIK